MSALTLTLYLYSLSQCCYWSDMFTGRLRSEIPPALVNTLLTLTLLSTSKHVGIFHNFPCLVLELLHVCNRFCCLRFGLHTLTIICLFLPCFVELTGRCSDAGGCQVDCFRPQRQRLWTRWGKGHREIAQEYCMLHITGATAQQLWHGHRRREGKSQERLLKMRHVSVSMNVIRVEHVSLCELFRSWLHR